MLKIFLCGVSPGPADVGDFLFCLVIFFDLVLLLKLQIELSGIHRSRSRVTEAKRSREDDAPLCYLVTNQPIRA